MVSSRFSAATKLFSAGIWMAAAVGIVLAISRAGCNAAVLADSALPYAAAPGGQSIDKLLVKCGRSPGQVLVVLGVRREQLSDVCRDLISGRGWQCARRGAAAACAALRVEPIFAKSAAAVAIRPGIAITFDMSAPLIIGPPKWQEYRVG